MIEEWKYAELHCHSNFSFLDGASSPAEIVEEAVRLELPMCAITDHNGFYGVVNFASSARNVGIQTIFGAEVTIGSRSPRDNTEDPQGEHLVILARNPKGYASLSTVLSQGHMADTQKGIFRLELDDLSRFCKSDWIVLSGCRKGRVARSLLNQGPSYALKAAQELIEVFGRDNFIIECWDHGDPIDQVRNDELIKIALLLGIRAVATNNVHYAKASGAKLHNVISAIRSNKTLDEIDGWLPVNQGAYLRSAKEQYRRFRRYPELVAQAYEVGLECQFDLALLAPKLPDSIVPVDVTQDQYLTELTMSGARERYGTKNNERVGGAYGQIEHELRVIAELGFAGYFLIVWDIVQFCRNKNIYCQGRGSAANSAVCYALAITNVDPVSLGLLFERFLSPERDGPPDIDVDIESERREEVIQYVYQKYGRDRAAQVANVITYRSRSSLRDVGRVFGYPVAVLNQWSKQVDRYHRPSNANPAKISDSQSFLEAPPIVKTYALELEHSPRHLGIHTGGMVICDRPIVEVCPIEWARRENRSVLQWDKDDCAIVGLVKFDLLGLGMLEALHRMVDMVSNVYKVEVDIAQIDQDPLVYEMLCAADTVGIFQVESRAQMATLPRLKPTRFYDLVVEVALIRPGPIQGGSVHPYIRRRNGLEPVSYLHPLLERSLKKTLGVPLFQEQLMQMAMDVADFSPSEADQLRQAMGSKRSSERMERLRERLFLGMENKGIPYEIAQEIFSKLKAFANFGFPESHSASFAYLVYASAWFKFHYPAAFYASIINSQPMGFWSRETLIEDAKRHGVVVLGPNVNYSHAKCSLEPCLKNEPGHTSNYSLYLETMIKKASLGPALRIGLSEIRGIGSGVAKNIQSQAPFSCVADLSERARLERTQLESLSKAGALLGLTADEKGPALSRRQAVWVSEPFSSKRVPNLPGMTLGDEPPKTATLTAKEQTYLDIHYFGMTPGKHPIAFLRDDLTYRGIISATELPDYLTGKIVSVAGVVTHRQRPATAKGTTFVSLEDETGLMNIIVTTDIWSKYRKIVRFSDALIITGKLESNSGVVNVIAKHIENLEIGTGSMSRDFH